MLPAPRQMFLPAVYLLLIQGAYLRAEEPALRQVIDTELRAGWEAEKLTPAPRSSDAQFLRRVYLDLVGTIPTADEAAAFLQDSAADKRTKLIDRLLDDPRFAEHQADVWGLVFFGRHPGNGDVTRNRDLFHKWLAEKFAKNEPYDRWVRELLLAEGNTGEQGPAMFYAQFSGKADETAVVVSRIFLGTQLQCARCHDHPFDKWKQLDFYGLAGFFARQVVLDAGTQGNMRRLLVAEKRTGEVLFSGPAADQKPGKKGDPVAARFLGGDVLEEPPLPPGFKEPELKGAKTAPKPQFSRKEKFAEWATARDNKYFARAAANRVWAQFMGRGLVDPVDDLRDNRKPSHPRLFQALHEQFATHAFDLKYLIREIVNSDAYQLGSTGDNTDESPRWYERARVRPLSAEEMMAAFRVATGHDAVSKEPFKGATREYFLRYFGEPTNGRGDFQASLTEHLFLNNSQDVRQLIQPRKGNFADSLLSSKAPWEERVDRVFLAVLSRPPREEERKKFVGYLEADKQPGTALEEAIWVLLNTAEFRFNH